MSINNKPILLRDALAIQLARARARVEHRPVANALSATVIEALSDRFGSQPCKDTKSGRDRQGKTD